MTQAIVLVIFAAIGSAITSFLGAVHYPPVLPPMHPFGFAPLPLFVPMVDPYHRFLRDAMANELLYGTLLPPPPLFHPLMAPFQHSGVLPPPFPRFTSYRQPRMPAKLSSLTRRHTGPQAPYKRPDWSSQENGDVYSEKQVISFNYESSPTKWNHFTDDLVKDRERRPSVYQREEYPLAAREELPPREMWNTRDAHSVQADWPALSSGFAPPWRADSSDAVADSSLQDVAAVSSTLNPAVRRSDYPFMYDFPQQEIMPIPHERIDRNSDKSVSERDAASPAHPPWTENKKAHRDENSERDGAGNDSQGTPGAPRDRETVAPHWRRSPPSYEMWEPVARYTHAVPQKWELARPEKEQSPPALQAQDPAAVGAEQSSTQKDVAKDAATVAPLSTSAPASPGNFHGAPTRDDLGRRGQIQLERVWPHPTFTQRLVSPPGGRDSASSVLRDGSQSAISSTTTSTSPDKSSSTTSVVLPAGEGKASCPEEQLDSYRLSARAGTSPSMPGNNVQDFPRNNLANSLFGRRFNYYPDNQFYNSRFTL